MSASVLKTSANRKSPEFEKNTRRIVDLLTEIKNEEEKIREGGGAKGIESQHKKGRLTARERIAKLIDPQSQFFEQLLPLEIRPEPDQVVPSHPSPVR